MKSSKNEQQTESITISMKGKNVEEIRIKKRKKKRIADVSALYFFLLTVEKDI